MRETKILLKPILAQLVHKNLVLVVLVVLSCSLISKKSFSQKALEIGGNAGVSYYMGDVNLNKHFYSPNPNFGGFVKFHFDRRNVLRAGAFYTKLSAYDKDFNNKFQQLRDHSFETSLIEIYAMYEVHFLQYIVCNNRRNTFTPYLNLGIATFFAPSAEKKFNFAIPMGIGIKKNILSRLVIGIEWSFRKTFSDRLDSLTGEDINTYDPNFGTSINENNSAKQTGFKYTKDWYSVASITISYAFKVGGLTCNAYYNR